MSQSIAELAKQAADYQLEKEAALGGVLSSLGRKALPALGRGAWSLGKGLGKGALGTAKLPLTATRAAGKGAVNLLRDTGKATVQAPQALGGVLNPMKSFRHYADAAGSMKNAPVAKQFGTATRNLLKDVAGVAPDRKTSVLGDVGRAFWNPSIPTMRALGKPLTLGSGGKLGSLATAGLAYGLGQEALNRGHHYLMDQPVTGIPEVDKLIGPEARERVNRELYYKTLPKTVWSGVTGQNPVDQRLLRQSLNIGGKNLWNAARGSLKPSQVAPMTGQQLALGEGKNLLFNMTQPFKQQSLMTALSNVPELAQNQYADYSTSEAGQGLRRAMLSAMPQDQDEWSQLGQRSWDAANRMTKNTLNAVGRSVPWLDRITQ